jgi:hypothetical protein
MPEYTFQIVIILIRGDNELSLVRNSHSLYATAILETVYHYAKPFLDDGYKLHKFYTQNYEFVEGE